MDSQNTLYYCDQKAKGTGETKTPYLIMPDKEKKKEKEKKNIYLPLAAVLQNKIVQIQQVTLACKSATKTV